MDNNSDIFKYEIQARQRSYPLLPYSWLVWEQKKLSPDIYYLHATLIFHLNPNLLPQLKQALEKAILNHPVFQTIIDEKGRQHYKPSDNPLKGPYHEFNLYAKSNQIYLDIKINRILGDAQSYMLLLEDLFRAYRGKPLPQDLYFTYLEQTEQFKQTDKYLTNKQWTEDHYSNLNYPVHPTTDTPLNTYTESTEKQYAEDYSDLFSAIQRLSKSNLVPLSAFFSLCAALAIMDYNETNKAALTWAYEGREKTQEQHIFGSLHRDIPFVISKEKNTTREQLLLLARNNIRQGIAHSSYPYTLTPPNDNLWNYAVNILHQPSPKQLLQKAPFTTEIVLHDDHPTVAYSLLDIEIYTDAKNLSLLYRYSSPHYKEDSIRRFARLVRKNAEWLLGIDATQKLKILLRNNKDIRLCLEQTIKKAAKNNPDRITNPVQSIPDLYVFLKRFLSSMPWQGLKYKSNQEKSVFRRTDQSTGYFYFIFQHLQYAYQQIDDWIRTFNCQWALFLNSKESWNNNYYQLLKSDPLFELNTGKYESEANWHCWNDFFSRKLASTEQLLTGKLKTNNPKVKDIVCPAEGIQYPFIAIDSQNILKQPQRVKTGKVMNIAHLLGDSPYRESFAKGLFTHITLDFFNYHHFHSPADGTVIDIRHIDGVCSEGGEIVWDKKQKIYRYKNNNNIGYQMLEKRAVIVIRKTDGSLVALVPVGVAQVSSIIINHDVTVGTKVRKGQNLGHFLCGGSDVILLIS